MATGHSRVSREARIPSRVEPLLREVGRLAAQHGTSAYAVGGCVRDWLLGISATPDVDVTVERDGIMLAQALGRLWHATVQVHQAFGTATLLLPGRTRRLDMATCRRETYARPGAYPRVINGTLQDDLFRRDFTVNAIAVATAPGRFGRLVDPFRGWQDLRAGRLRVLHQQSFIDDPSRILRGIRFSQRFGFGWERKTARALREAMAQGALGWLNAGRLHKEFALMLEEPDPLACFGALAVQLEATGARSGEPTAA